MKILLVFFLFVIFLLSCIYSCYFKHPVDTGNYEITYKKFDPEYLLQENYLQDCINLLSKQKLNDLKDYKDELINQASYLVYSEIGFEKQQLFKKKGLAKCLEILANHKAKKQFCPSYELQYKFYDLIEQYLLIEHNECVKQKNSPFINEILYEIPFNIYEEPESILI
ncbi:hypothetical protein GVAV_001991 [Gurleya vavrai]